jgi:hypothetical protein
MDETGVNHPIRGGGSTAQAVQIPEITSMHLGTSGSKRLGGCIGASKAEYLVSRGDQFSDDGGADESSRAGNEDTHKKILRV